MLCCYQVFVLALPLLVGGVTGCQQVAKAVGGKSISAEVVAGARVPGCWYAYLPERAPGFCLCTERELVWRDLGVNLGYWQGLHPDPPHRVLMEARGDVFVVHRRYVWDGMSVGETLPRDLMPTLLHDALYHALKEGAVFPRRVADRLFLQEMRRAGVQGAGLDYALIRCFGGLFLKRGEVPTMLVRPLPPPGKTGR